TREGVRDERRRAIVTDETHVGRRVGGATSGRYESGADGAEAGGDDLPRVWVGVGAWQMQHESAGGARDAHADLEQHEAQTADLGPRERRAIGAELEFLQQDVCGGRQRDAELIRPEARAAGAADGEVVLQFLQTILAVAPRTVDRATEPFGSMPQIGDHDARVVPEITSGVDDDFG